MTKIRDADLDVLMRAMQTGDGTGLDERLQQRIARIEQIARMIFSKTFLYQTDVQLAKRVAREHGITPQLARKDVSLAKQLYQLYNPTDIQFKRLQLVHSIEMSRNECVLRGDHETALKADKLLADMYSKMDVPDTSTAVQITINTYNPELMGAKIIPNLEEKVQKMIAADKKRLTEGWEDFEIIKEKAHDYESED